MYHCVSESGSDKLNKRTYIKTKCRCEPIKEIRKDVDKKVLNLKGKTIRSVYKQKEPSGDRTW